MKSIIKFSVVVVIMLASISVQAQDPHFSQYSAVPLTLNPAMTGLFSGNYRVTAIYRNQWQSILNQDDPQGVPYFRTFAGSADLRFNRGGGANRKNGDAIGIGFDFMTDKAGALSFGTNQVYVNFSYLKSLGNSGSYNTSQYLSIGFQGGVGMRGVDYTNARFGNQFTGESWEPVPHGEVIGDDNFVFFDLGTGVFWYYATGKRNNYYAGVSLGHLNRPNMSFVDGEDARLYMKISFNGGVQFPLSTQVDLLPSILVQSQGPSLETMIGAYAKVFFEGRNPMGNAFYIGPYYRFVRGDKEYGGAIGSDALIFATKVDIEGVTIGFSYDLNFSELTEASNSNGGFEVSIAYIGAWQPVSKKPCPRF